MTGAVSTAIGRVRGVASPGTLIGLALFLAFPWLPFTSFSVIGSANSAAYYAMVAVSLVVLTGWVGQISLGHAGLVGVGAFVSGHVINGWHISFPVNILWAALVGAVVAAGLGAVAVRVRGLYLAVATLIFGWMAAEYLFRQTWFTRNSSVEVEPFGQPGTFPYFDWTSRRTYFYAAWALVAAAIFVVANLRDSKTGRAFFAVRGSEVAAASLGISVVRTKLCAFAVSGALAAAAGNLLLVRDQVVTADSFRVETSLFFLAIAVVGGLQSLGGAVAAAVLFAALDELFFRFPVFTGWLEVVPPVLLTASLLLYRGGLGALGTAVRTRLSSVAARLEPRRADIAATARALWERLFPEREPVAPEPAATVEADRTAPTGRPASRLLARFAPVMLDRRLESPERLDIGAAVASRLNGHGGRAKAAPAASDVPVDVNASPAPTAAPRRTWRDLPVEAPSLAADRLQRPVVLEAEGVTVRFGGLTAADSVSLTVREGEIVGLIGPNGAGKTTTFNAIAGLNVPQEGRIRVFGHDVTTWTVDDRARLGVGRTFQAIQLLPQLTVFENLLVATHIHNPSGFLSHVFMGPATLRAEREARRQVAEVAELLELDEVLDRRVADLPFGVLRMVEVARALVAGPRLIMLDEPASGLDNTETEQLAELLQFVRSIGVTLLLIEHDVKMVVGVSDYMYVLDHGALLAEGRPEEIQRDERVIASYLGTTAEAEAAGEDEAAAPVPEKAGARR